VLDALEVRRAAVHSASVLTDPSSLEVLSFRDGVTAARWQQCFFTIYRAPLSADVLEHVAAVRREVADEIGRHGLINIADPRFTGRVLDSRTRRVMLTKTEEFSPHTICALHVVPGDGLLIALARKIVQRMHWLGGPRVEYPSKVVATVDEDVAWFVQQMAAAGAQLESADLLAATNELDESTRQRRSDARAAG
jgi:hypothetical protein